MSFGGARPSRLRHVSVRLRVTVDPEKWEGTDLEREVRDWCVERLRQEPLVVSVRRDGE